MADAQPTTDDSSSSNAGLQSLGISDEQVKQLNSLGLLKPMMDQIAQPVIAHAAAEDDAAKDAASTAIAGDVAKNPDLADVVQRTVAKLSGGDAAPPPTANGVPTATLAPAAEVPATTEPTPTPAPTDSNATPQVEAPPGGASGSWEPNPAPVAVNPATLSQTNKQMASAAGSGQSTSDQILGLGMQGILSQQQAAFGQAALVAKSAPAVAAMWSHIANQYGAIADNFNIQRQGQEAAIKAQQDKQAAAVDQFNTLQIDPNHFWGSLSTPQKIGAGIGMVLGGTPAVGIIQNAIKNDVDLQKANFDLKAKGLDARHTLLDDMFKVAGNIDDAQNMAEAALLKHASLKMQAMTAGAAGPAALFAAQETSGKLQGAAADLLMKVAGNAGLQLQQLAGGAGAPSGMTSANGSPLGALGRIPNVDTSHAAGLGKDIAGRVAPGIGLASDPKTASQLADMHATFQSIMSDSQGLKTLLQKNGPTGFQTEARTTAQAYASRIKNSLTSMAGEHPNVTNSRQLGPLADQLSSDPIMSPQDAGGNILTAGLDAIGNKIMGDRRITQVDNLMNGVRQQYISTLGSNLLAKDPALMNSLLGQTDVPKSSGSK